MYLYKSALQRAMNIFLLHHFIGSIGQLPPHIRQKQLLLVARFAVRRPCRKKTHPPYPE